VTTARKIWSENLIERDHWGSQGLYCGEH